MAPLAMLLVTVTLYFSLVFAQTSLQEQIWGTVSFHFYGDRTPYIMPNPVLTPLGAQQMFTVGTNLRSRYVNPTVSDDTVDTSITGISAFQIDNEQIGVLTFSDEYFVASSQAALQGLYPPVETSLNFSFINGQSELANGSNVVSPLSGYQYPQIYTASEVDLNSIYIAGNLDCPMYSTSRSDYFNSEQFEQLQDQTASFYASLQPDILDGVFTNASVGYFDAYYIWDYLNYGFVHNNSIASSLSTDDLLQARTLADQWIFALNGNTTASGATPGDQIRAIAGRTLAYEVARALYTNINTQGTANKMTLMFGSYEPMVSFAALAGLASDQHPQFFGQPNYGSSMIFELYSLEPNRTTAYPEVEDLMVRFLFQNGTEANSTLEEFALFGRDPSQSAMALNDFISQIENFMIQSIGDWCETCDSFSVFCPAYVGDSNDNSTGTTPVSVGQDSHHGMKPAVAGVIGAIVALAIAGLVVAILMLLFGFRVYRNKTNKKSDLGGFKGGEKLASDQDLTIPKSGAGASVVTGAAEGPRGHERIGSWELSQAQGKETGTHLSGSTFADRRRSLEDDELHVTPFANPVKADDKV